LGENAVKVLERKFRKLELLGPVGINDQLSVIPKPRFWGIFQNESVCPFVCGFV